MLVTLVHLWLEERKLLVQMVPPNIKYKAFLLTETTKLMNLMNRQEFFKLEVELLLIEMFKVILLVQQEFGICMKIFQV